RRHGVSPHCCRVSTRNRTAGASNQPTGLVRRSPALAGWIVPAGYLMLLPKCPACLAAYVAIVTGLGISLSTPTDLRIVAFTMGIIAMIYFAGKSGWYQLSSVAGRRSGSHSTGSSQGRFLPPEVSED